MVLRIPLRKTFTLIVFALAFPLFGWFILSSSDSHHALFVGLRANLPGGIEGLSAVLFVMGVVFLNRLFFGYESMIVERHQFVRKHNRWVVPRRASIPTAVITDPEVIRNAKSSTYWGLKPNSWYQPEWTRIYDRIPVIVKFKVNGFERVIGRDLEDFDAEALVKALRKAR